MTHEDTYGIFDGMVEDVLYLQFILVVAVRVTQVTEFISQVDALFDVFRGNKVLCYFDTRVKIPHLVKIEKHRKSINNKSQSVTNSRL